MQISSLELTETVESYKLLTFSGATDITVRASMPSGDHK